VTQQLYGHRFSSYTWKPLIALYETGTPFEFRDVEQADVQAELASHWPVAKFPLLVDGGEPIMESTIIIEHVAPKLVPADRDDAREVRMLDRVFDNAVMTPMQAGMSRLVASASQIPLFSLPNLHRFHVHPFVLDLTAMRYDMLKLHRAMPLDRLTKCHDQILIAYCTVRSRPDANDIRAVAIQCHRTRLTQTIESSNHRQ